MDVVYYNYMQPQTKKCSGPCGLDLPIEDFYLRSNRAQGKKYRRTNCGKCFMQALREHPDRKKRHERGLERTRERRSSGLHRARFLLHDCRSSDRKYGRTFNLDFEFVTKMLEFSCSYCGDNELLRTLDRIDNYSGHTKENVVTSCIRCNYLRRDMPYAAWLCLVPAVRDAYQKGLFGTWEPSTRKKRSRVLVEKPGLEPGRVA